MAGLDPLELDIRRWWYLLKKNYEDGTSNWLLCADWPKWKQIGYLLEQIDRLHHQQRAMELAADDTKDTEHLSAVFRPRPPTSEDTIPVMWAPGPPSAALTPVKAFPSVPLPGLEPELPHHASFGPPPLPSNHALTPVAHNRLVMQCETVAETTLKECLRTGVSAHAAIARVITALKGLRMAIPMDMPLDDDGYTK